VIKDPFPLLFLLGLMIIIFFSILYMSQSGALQQPEDGAEGLCSEGATRSCSVGPCAGISRCSGGEWGGCKWQTICAPGTSSPCINDSCVYGYKVCDGCGTGYGPCGGAEKCC